MLRKDKTPKSNNTKHDPSSHKDHKDCEPKRCETCANRNVYHNYLHELRKQREENQNKQRTPKEEIPIAKNVEEMKEERTQVFEENQRIKEISKRFMQSSNRNQFVDNTLIECGVPMVKSQRMNAQITQFKQISRVQEIAREPQSIEKDFLDRMSNKISEYEETPQKIKSIHNHEIIQAIEASFKQSPYKSNTQPVESDFNFQIQIFDSKTGTCHSRKFTALQYGLRAVEQIQMILRKAGEVYD